MKIRQWLLGHLMVWQAKREGMSKAEIDSGLMVCSIKELELYNVEVAPLDRSEDKA